MKSHGCIKLIYPSLQREIFPKIDVHFWRIHVGPPAGVHSETNTLRARAARFARALRPSAFGLRLVAGGLRAYTAPMPLDLVYPCTRREVSTEGSMALEDL